MSRPLHIWLAYVAAFAAALGLAWFTQALMVQRLMAPGGAGLSLVLVWILPILAGLSGFALLFGLIMRVTMRASYWLGGLLLCLGTSAAVISLIYLGFATPVEAGLAGLLIMFFLGRLMVGRLVMVAG